MRIGNGNITIADLMRFVVNNVAMTKHYKGWSDEFSRKENAKALYKLQEKFEGFDFFACSREELFELGFGTWDNNGLMLIPLYLYDAIPDGTVLKSIMGETAVKGTDEIDLDVRFGCIAYGIFDEKWKKEEEL